MSIASAITAAQGRVADCYTAISNKGGTLPATQNLANMPTAIGSISTGGTIDSLTITPTTSQQTITASGGVDGYSPITVNAVTHTIDSNISAGNIVSGVTILGVQGSATELNATTASVTPTTSAQTITPTSPYNAFDEISVSAVTSSIDNNITAGNIKSGVSILGVSGSLTPLNGTTLSVTPTTSAQSLSPSSPYNGYTSVSVSAVTASIDANIIAGNIKKDVQILGVTGTYEGGGATKYGTTVDNYIGDTVSGEIIDPAPLSQDLNFTGVTGVAARAFTYKFYYNQGSVNVSFPDIVSLSNKSSFEYAFGYSGILSISFPKLEEITGDTMFAYCCVQCKSLTSADLSKLKIADSSNALANMFMGCTSLTSLDLSSLEKLSYGSALYYLCSGCTNFESLDLSSLKYILGSYCCGGLCSNTKITTMSFPSLSEIRNSNCFNYAFTGCKVLENLYFPALTNGSFMSTSFTSILNSFSGMFNSGTSGTAATSGTCTVHFPSNMQTSISGMSGYPTFGGDSSRIVLSFDLPATQEYDLSWTRPNLTADGTMGGSSFAVTASDYLTSSYHAYYAVDSNTTSSWSSAMLQAGHISTYFEFYNPSPLKLYSLNIIGTIPSNTYVKIEGSNDESNWETYYDVQQPYQQTNLQIRFDIPPEFKYYKITFYITGGGGSSVSIRNLTMNAIEQVVS